MTQEEVFEYNKRCAEFLGLKRGWWIHQEKPLTENKKQWWDIDGKTFLGTKVYYDKNLQFHSDWNWIMEVVEAIEKLGYKFQFGWNITALISLVPNTPAKIALIENENRKEAVVQAINQFLIWYNGQRT